MGATWPATAVAACLALGAGAARGEGNSGAGLGGAPANEPRAPSTRDESTEPPLEAEPERTPAAVAQPPSAAPAGAPAPPRAAPAETRRAPSEPAPSGAWNSTEARDAAAVAERASAGGEPERRWYGWQTLVVDGGWVAASLIASQTHDDGVLATSTALVVVGYFLGPPIVHFAHGHVGKGLGSFALRVAGPILLVAGLGGGAGDGGGGNGADGAVLLGALMIPAAIAIDAAVLAREDVPAAPPFAFERVHLAPWVLANRRAAGLGAAVDW